MIAAIARRLHILFSLCLGVLVSLPLMAQETSGRWTDLFSYGNVRHIWEIDGVLYCSAENGIFTYDPVSGELEKISKINILNDVGISAFTYSYDLDLMLIGYERGEMDMIGPDYQHNLLEIPLHQAYTGSKIVNHIAVENTVALISGEFGVASFNLENFEFMETTYFSLGGYYFGVKESAVLNGVIFSASDAGVFTHPLNEFMANFVNWEHQIAIPNSPFQQVVEFQGNIFASTWNNVYRFDGSNWTLFGHFTDLMDITVSGDVMSIVSLNQIVNFNESLAQIETIPFVRPLKTGKKIGSKTYGGALNHGLIDGNFEILPDGPYNNKAWSITSLGDQIWIAPGGMRNFNAPSVNYDGFYHFNGTHWIHNSSEEMLNAKDILDIEVNPKDTTEIYVSSWFEHPSWGAGESTRIGMFRFKNGQMMDHYNSQNSGLKFRERIGGSALDDQGNLWVSQSYADSGGKTLMHRKTPSNQWQTIDLGANVINAGARKPLIYEGYAFVALPRRGGVKVTDMTNVYSINTLSTNGDLPSDYVYALAIDKDGILWIGTELGLRILYSPIQSIQQDAFMTYPIIIEQNGIPEALFNDVQINHIEVDSSNNKWFATQTNGVYYMNDDGTEIIFHFTAENSPLPSNSVYDIRFEPLTGIVYFATEKGVVSYQSDAVDVGDSFGDVYAYPNPVRPGFTGNVTIKGLPIDADVRIVDVVGNLIYQTKSSGGVAIWDTKNFKGKPVASGIYIVMMTNKDATQTKQTKIAIVR